MRSTWVALCTIASSAQTLEVTYGVMRSRSNISFLTALYSIIRGQHFSLFGPNYQQRDLRLFFEQNSHQFGFVAHHT